MINLNLSLQQYQPDLRTKMEGQKTFIWDPIRKKYVRFNPEEHVRQLLIQLLIQRLGWSKNLIAVEKNIEVGLKTKRFDILLYSDPKSPTVLIECKAPDQPIRQRHFDQILQYNAQLGARYIWVSNGPENYLGKILGNQVEFLSNLDSFQKA